MSLLGSLHARVIVALLLTLGGLWVSALVHARHRALASAEHEVDARLEAAAIQLFRTTLATNRSAAPSDEAATRPRVPSPPEIEKGARIDRSRLPSFEIVWKDGRPSMRSADFPRDIGATPVGLQERETGGRTWRVLTVVHRRHEATGRFALDDLALATVASERHRDVVGPLLWILPLLAAAALGSIWYGLAPLRGLERALKGQDPSDLGLTGVRTKRLPSELRRLTLVIDRLLSRLRDVLDRQRTFTSAAAHELRTPLAGCRIQLQVAERSRDVSVRARALVQARRSLDRMDRLVDQLLDLARIDVGIAEVSMRRVDIATLIASEIALHERSAASAGVTLGSRAGLPDASVLGNAPLLRSMVGNLIDNAIKFSPRQAAVDITLEGGEGQMSIRVRDRGPGVPAAERERAFDPFHRDNESGRPGSGLGLTTVRAIARAHGGDARLDAPPSGGTEAVVTLPSAKPSRADR